MTDGPLPQRRGIGEVARTLFARHDPFLVTLIGFLLVKAYYARILGVLVRSVTATLLLETAAIVVVLGLVDISRKRRPYLLDLGAYAVLSVITLANTIYAQMFGYPIDPKMIAFAAQVGDVQSSVFDLMHTTHWAMIADLPIMLVITLLIVRARRKAPQPPRKRWKLGVVVGLAAIVLAVQVGAVLMMPTDLDPITVAARRGLGPQQLATLLRMPFAAVGRPADASTTGTATTDAEFQSQIEAVRQASSASRITTFTPGAYKGSNVIVIQVESLLGFAIGARVEGQEITPNINRLIEESWYFPNTFSQTSGGNTSDAEFSENSGLPAPLTDAAAIAYADRVIPALPRLLRGQGYRAVTMHTNYIRFWNRDQLYPALGFDRWYDHAYFLDRDPMWHASDQTLFTYGMKVLDPIRVSGTPFYSQFITMSSHHPFKFPVASRRPLKLTGDKGSSYLGRYLGSISYADLAIGEFIAALKSNGLYEKSIIVVYGDHTGLRASDYGATDMALMEEVLGRPLNIADEQRVALVVHLPGQTQSSLSRETLGQVDIMPTVADALGLDISAVPHIGKSAFVTSPGLVQTRSYLPAGTTITDRALFVPGLTPSEGKAFALADGAPIPVTPQDLAAYERARRLNTLSAEWMSRLPRRPDAARVNETGF